MSVSRLGYIILGAKEPSAWEDFGKNILGAMVDVRSSGSVEIKIDDHPFRVLVEQNDQDELLTSAWEVDDIDEYERILDKLQSDAIAVDIGSESDAANRRVEKFFKSTDPAGNSFEVYLQRTDVGVPFKSPLDVSEFITGDMGMGHVVVPAPNLAETRSFYETYLGLKLSDDLSLPGPDGAESKIRIFFFHADNPRHHSLALFNQPVPSKIVHFMFEVSNIDEVGTCLDRVNNAKLPLMATLGRHCNDNMLSFYVFGPGHIPVEFGYDGYQIETKNYEATVSTSGDHWGHVYRMPS